MINLNLTSTQSKANEKSFKQYWDNVVRGAQRRYYNRLLILVQGTRLTNNAQDELRWVLTGCYEQISFLTERAQKRHPLTFKTNAVL